MDQKALISNVVTAVVTTTILGILGVLMGVFNRGAQAINEDQIESVVRSVLITDQGKTYAATLSDVNGTLIAIDTKIGIMQEDVANLESAILDLVSE